MSVNIAKIKKIQRISPIWFIPIVAACIGLWMVFLAFHNQGPLITLQLDNAEGLEPGKTSIKARSVEVGRVQTVKLSDDLKHVVVTARMNVEAEPLLKKDSRFWVVKPRVGKSGISGLTTLLSGSYLELQPGKSKDSELNFTVMDTPPITSINAPGLRLTLTSDLDSALSVGDPVLYRGFTVGSVEQVGFDTKTRLMDYKLFIQAPYDALITTSTRFWMNSGIQIKAGADGIKVKTGTLETMMSGGVSFGIPPGWDLGNPIKDQRSYNLYQDEDSSSQRRYQESIQYLLLFDDSIRGLSAGAPVEYRGIQIGSVEQAPYMSQDHNLLSAQVHQIPVLIRIEPGRILNAISEKNLDQWQQGFSDAIKQGLRASLRSGNLLTGSLYVDLNFYTDQPKAKGLGHHQNFDTIPTVSTGINRIEQQVITLLNKLNSLDMNGTLNQTKEMLQETQKAMAHVRQVSDSIDKIANQQSSRQLPADVQKTLGDVQKALQGLSANSPAYSNLNDSINSLNKVLRELQPMTRVLSEKPNALLFQPNQAKDPEPRKADK